MATFLRSEVRKRGFLYKLPVTGGVLKVWAKRWIVLKITTHEGVVRLEYYDKEEDEVKGINKRVILLRNSTGCCETNDYKKSRPFAFQFSSNLGHHVFATDSKDELDDWIDEINLAIQDDRKKQRRKTKSKIPSTNASSTSTPPTTERGSTGTSGHHPTTLMGVYRVMIEDNDFAKRLGATGIHSLNITPRGIKLISSTDETTIASWHYKHIRSYGKFSNQQIKIEIGGNAKSGHGKLAISSSSSREMFSMIHRNIKILKAKQEEAREAEIKMEVEEVSEKRRKKRSSLIRPHSMSYDVQQPLPKQTSVTSTGSASKRTSFPSFAEQSTIEESFMQLEGFGENEVVNDLQEFLDSLDPISHNDDSGGAGISAPLPELGTVNELANSTSIYETIDFPIPSNVVDGTGPVEENFEDSFISNPAQQHQTTNPFTDSVDPFSSSANPFTGNTTDPFTSSIDPFSASTRGSFYNSQEDIFDGFNSSNQKTSTPSSKNPSSNPFSAPTKSNSSSTNPFEIEEGLQNVDLSSKEYIYAVPNKSKKVEKKMSKEEFDKVWEDITADLTLP